VLNFAIRNFVCFELGVSVSDNVSVELVTQDFVRVMPACFAITPYSTNAANSYIEVYHIWFHTIQINGSLLVYMIMTDRYLGTKTRHGALIY
jgi:hypothetical protein